jgi:hypothetical protein
MQILIKMSLGMNQLGLYNFMHLGVAIAKL